MRPRNEGFGSNTDLSFFLAREEPWPDLTAVSTGQPIRASSLAHSGLKKLARARAPLLRFPSLPVRPSAKPPQSLLTLGRRRRAPPWRWHGGCSACAPTSARSRSLPPVPSASSRPARTSPTCAGPPSSTASSAPSAPRSPSSATPPRHRHPRPPRCSPLRTARGSSGPAFAACSLRPTGRRRRRSGWTPHWSTARCRPPARARRRAARPGCTSASRSRSPRPRGPGWRSTSSAPRGPTRWRCRGSSPSAAGGLCWRGSTSAANSVS